MTPPDTVVHAEDLGLDDSANEELEALMSVDDVDDAPTDVADAGDDDTEPAAVAGDEPAASEPEPADAAAPEGEVIAREDGAQWNAKANRWQKDGKFVEGEAPASAAPAADAPPATEQAAPVPAWEPLSITVDRSAVQIPEAVIAKANGHVLLGIPEAKFAEFQRRLVKGVTAERTWRQLNDGLKQLEEEKRLAAERPAVRSDSEVEADVILGAIKDRLGELFDDVQLENLQLKVETAQMKERQKVGEWERSRTTKATEAQDTERQMLEGIATTIVEIVEDPQFQAEFQDLTEDELCEVMADLKPYSRAVIWRDGEQWQRNTQLVYDRLKAKAAQKRSSVSSTSAPAAPATPAPTAGTTATATRAERFNQGQATAVIPSTSVKAARTATQGRPAVKAAHHRTPRAAETITPAQRAEDEYRKKERSYLTSPTLDFEDDDE